MFVVIFWNSIKCQVENVKQRCLPNALNYPMLEEYDFRNDTVSLFVAISLIPCFSSSNCDLGKRMVSNFNYFHIFCMIGSLILIFTPEFF